jgi:hypothetical protein
VTHRLSEDISKLDDSCISNPKSEISNWTRPRTVQFAISDFGFEMQESSNFEISLRLSEYLVDASDPGKMAP